ncbi:hypothetical protein DGG96_11725 [Legionella qingyii]|uniref:Uncharacterized protein n=1 Tax=Legionella qingyii TaxID=2184757 RepID=A0A317U0T0_9GAMM|nr:hypothetical protein [Legionella qingyii]PWY55441.1 hypothetical protein DGG96_11725 [Legionella qingyii]RUR21355.1 hypothetical protein ELY20_12710 [Legionella qingyii]RUR24579.1 hypothetical protein ELY16_11545 [Legionella qingyii]
MSGKGLAYWRQAWQDAGFGNNYENALYLLKRYARQSFNTYGKDVANFYFGESRSIFAPSISHKSCRLTRDERSMERVIKDLQGILDGRPIYQDGDLHNILKVFGEKMKQDCTTSFKIVQKPSFFEHFMFLEYFLSLLQKCFGNDPTEKTGNGFSPKN